MKPTMKQMIDPQIPLYDFVDFRLYLKMYFQVRKKIEEGFSYKKASEAMGFNSRGYIHQIIAGDVKKLSTSQIYRISEYLEQDDTEREFFFNLICFNQAEDDREKQYFFSKMNDFVDPCQGQTLHKDQYEYFSSWHISVLRELITMKSFDGDLKKLAHKVSPSISEEECKKGIALLKRLGLIEKTASGRYFQTQLTLRTGPEIHRMAWRKLSEDVARLGLEATERHPAKSRDLSGITFGVTESGVEQVRAMVHKFRKEIFELLPEWDDDMDRVYQLNLQLFPLSDFKEKKTPL